MAVDSKELWLEIHSDIPDTSVSLGKATSAAYFSDPKMLGFILSRYKFVSKMLEGKERVLEMGCGDGFGAPVVSSVVGKQLYCTDIDEKTLADNSERLKEFKNLSFEYHDFREKPFHTKMDAIYSVDVIEHVYKDEEENLLNNLLSSLNPNGVMVFGTPNIFASQYASEYSERGHVNLKDHVSFKAQLLQFFNNVFIFSMNDEVLHTGYHKMAHYIWALCVEPKE